VITHRKSGWQRVAHLVVLLTTPVDARPIKDPTAVFLQQSRIGVPSAMMTVTGRLAQSPEGCLLLKSDKMTWLILWPPETRLLSRHPVRLSDASGRPIMIGDELELGGTGGARPSVRRVGKVIIPASCRSYNGWITDRLGVKKLERANGG
jgi:hypothetical protein